MAVGLEIYDANGGAILQSFDKTLQPVGFYPINSAADGAISVPAIGGNIGAFAIFANYSQTAYSIDPTVTVDTNGYISWYYDANTLSRGLGSTGMIVYGIQ